MKNREVYLRDPSEFKLANEGVANVNDDVSSESMAVLRYELETFVCDGQYEKGLEHIIGTYLRNIDQSQQPGVWVSGFFGSGKSHLVKMLRALWLDTKFEDGATARDIADLPMNIRDQFVELSNMGKRHGGLHAASGTLGAGASGSVRLALLGIVFKSVGLPESYPVASFIIWLKSAGLLDDVRNWIEQNGYDWEIELANFHVSEGIPKALVNLKPENYSSQAICRESLNNGYPYVTDISNNEMTEAVNNAIGNNDKFPLTLIVLDELQQYIGEDVSRSSVVQEVVEECTKYFGGKILFIGTGQTAITGTPNLKKLEGRFTVGVALSDADVEAVIRKVLLAKKPEAIQELELLKEANIGEISKHYGYQQDDEMLFSQDYAILPSRRRFWEQSLRVLDPTGTDGQLRNQLRMVHKAIQTNLDEQLGNVIPAEFLYFDSATRLLQSRILPRKFYEKTMSWIDGTDEERLRARACGLIFLINKLVNNDLGIRPTAENIADLMVKELIEGSASLRSVLPGYLKGCEIIDEVHGEYQVRTEESGIWNDDFMSERNRLASEAHRVDTERSARIQGLISKKIKTTLVQGESRVSRQLHPNFDSKLPADNRERVYLWIRDEWGVDLEAVREDARQAGNDSPTVFIFIPKRFADDLRNSIIDCKAASATLEKKGVPNTPEGIEARNVIEAYKLTSEGRMNEILEESFINARVFQGNGTEIQGNELDEMISEAAKTSLQRLYREFKHADVNGWDKVYSQAQKGSPDALKAIGYDGETAKNPVCKAILSYLAAGKKGSEVRDHFEAPPYGWSRDAVDGALQVCLVTGLVMALDDRGKQVAANDLERKQIGKVVFKQEIVVPSINDYLNIRMLLQRAGFNIKPGEELKSIPVLLKSLNELADKAGGDAPKPEKPDVSILEEIRLLAGNEQIVATSNRFDELSKAIDEWMSTAEAVEDRWQVWLRLGELIKYSEGIGELHEARQQAEAIESQRMLLMEPDPVTPLLKTVEDVLRKELNSKHNSYSDEMLSMMEQLNQDSSWKELTEDERREILRECGIIEVPVIHVGTYEDLRDTLVKYPLHTWDDRLDAISGRFARARGYAAKSLEPETQILKVPRDKTLKTEDDVNDWIGEVEKKLKGAIKQGPVVID